MGDETRDKDISETSWIFTDESYGDYPEFSSVGPKETHLQVGVMGEGFISLSARPLRDDRPIKLTVSASPSQRTTEIMRANKHLAVVGSGSSQ